MDLDFYFLLFIYFILFIYLVLCFTRFVSLMLLVELLWIVSYSLVLVLSLFFDNITTLSLTFFILIFSASEVSVGFIFFNFFLSSNTDITLRRTSNTFKWLQSTYHTL